MLFAQIILAHLIGDFVLQPRTWVAEKEERKVRSPKLYLHILVHFALLILLTSGRSFWLPALIISAAHLIIDLTKVYAQSPNSRRFWFFADQGLHFAVITAVLLWFEQPSVDGLRALGSVLFPIAAGVTFLTVPAAVAMQVILSKFSPEIGEENSLAKAGRYIGMLERVLILIFILIGQWEGVGFLLAAKSIFRFGDLKEARDRKLTEYIMIGTLLSFGIALLTGIFLNFLLAGAQI